MAEPFSTTTMTEPTTSDMANAADTAEMLQTPEADMPESNTQY